MRTKSPHRQVCPLCADDEFVHLSSEGPDLWVFTCSGTARHIDPYVWRPTQMDVGLSDRTGIGEELGVYDDLRACVYPGETVEYGIVEHRFSVRAPSTYLELLKRYGHASIADTRYSASSFLAQALGRLAREGALVYRLAPATGYWSYLTSVSAWSLDDEGLITSWATYATDNGLDPDDWAFAATALNR